MNMKSKSTDNLSTQQPSDSSVKTEWIGKVTELLPDLLYPSESDEPIEWFELDYKASYPLKINDLVAINPKNANQLIEEISSGDFWIPITTYEDWFGDEEREQLQKFGYIRQVLEENLPQQQIFKIGEIEKDLWLIGPISEGKWGGLKTKVVES